MSGDPEAVAVTWATERRSDLLAVENMRLVLGIGELGKMLVGYEEENARLHARVEELAKDNETLRERVKVLDAALWARNPAGSMDTVAIMRPGGAR